MVTSRIQSDAVRGMVNLNCRLDGADSVVEVVEAREKTVEVVVARVSRLASEGAVENVGEGIFDDVEDDMDEE